LELQADLPWKFVKGALINSNKTLRLPHLLWGCGSLFSASLMRATWSSGLFFSGVVILLFRATTLQWRVYTAKTECMKRAYFKHATGVNNFFHILNIFFGNADIVLNMPCSSNSEGVRQ